MLAAPPAAQRHVKGSWAPRSARCTPTSVVRHGAPRPAAQQPASWAGAAPPASSARGLAAPSSSPPHCARTAVVARDSAGAHKASVSTAPPAAAAATTAAAAGQTPSSAAAGSDSNVQEVKGLKELLLQQQAVISSLQQDVQELKNALVHGSTARPVSSAAGTPQPQQPQPHSGAAAAAGGPPVSTPGVSQPPSWRQPPKGGAAPQQQYQVPIVPHTAPQQQQQQQQQAISTSSYQSMSIDTFRALPDKIVLVRHAESQGNVDATTYSKTPDYEVALSAQGWEQAVACGNQLRALMEAEHGPNYKLFFMTSPYCRTRQTFVGIRQAFPDANFAGVQEEVQLREQDFGNFQDPAKIQADLAERNRFGRFYYRFPDGESGSDVYNRISIFEDHLIRDMKACRFSANTSLCLVTHGLTMRVFLMRWFNWTVESFLQVYNPPNATPIIVEKISEADYLGQISKLRERRQSLQVKQAYRMRRDSKQQLKMTTVTTDHIDLVAHNFYG